MNDKIMNSSPDGRHKVRLFYKGEIRFGPSFFRLELDGKTLFGRVFGETFCWSDDSKYLAIQEWLTTDYQDGPITRVMLVDVETNRFSEFTAVEKGFVQSFRFVGNIFVYRKQHYVSGQVTEAEVEISSISNWKKITWLQNFVHVLSTSR